MLGAIAAWVAVIAQFYFAPLVLFPLLVGVGLGAMLIGLMRVAQIGHRPTLWLGAVLAAAVAVVGQHYLSYREAIQRRERDMAEAWQKARVPWAELPKGWQPGFAEYMRLQAARGRPLVELYAGEEHGKPVFRAYTVSGVYAWLSWAADGLLLAVAAAGLILPATWQPYCNGCRSWYRTIRSGRIVAATARRVAEAAGLPPGQQIKWARYRLSNCGAGCGPTRLELSWEEPGGRTLLSDTWLDADGRDRIGQALDEG
jgi:hypothetical protein